MLPIAYEYVVCEYVLQRIFFLYKKLAFKISKNLSDGRFLFNPA